MATSKMLTVFSVGDRRESVTKVAGPSAYSSGGFTLSAKTLGLKYIEHIDFTLSDDGLLFAIAKAPSLGATSVTVKVYTAITMAENTTADISARTFVARAIGL
jgi:hypothetical protein